MNNCNTRLDVLVTFYNQEKYVDRALESIFSQQCNFSFNVLIGDDGSTDLTLLKVDEWSQKYPGRVFVYSMDREQGKKYIGGFRASQNRLNLLKYVTSEYFIYLDGDDYFTDIDKFQIQIDILDNPENNDCVACSHDILAAYPDGKNELYNKATFGQGKVTVEQYWFRDYFHTDTTVVRSSVIPNIHKELLINNFNDNLITYDIFQNGKIYYLKKAMAAYDQNGDGIWTGEKQLINNIRNMFLYDLCLIINQSLKYQNKIRFYTTWKWFYKNRNNIDKSSVEILVKEAEERNLIYSLKWLDFPENRSDLLKEYYKIFVFATIDKNLHRAKKLFKIIFHYIRKVAKKGVKVIKDYSFQNLYKKNLGYSDIKKADASLLKKCANHVNELGASIAQVFDNKSGIITIISDDGEYETSKKLNLLSKEYNIPMTVAGNIINVAPNIDHWKTLIKEGNIELVNHSYNHYRMDDDWEFAKDENRFIHEIVHAKTFLRNQLGIKDKIFVCPENAINELGYKVLADDGMVAVRRGDRGINSLCPSEGTNPGDWFNLKCYGIMDKPKPLQIREEMRYQWLKGSVGNWLIEMWHNVDIDGYQSISYREAQNHLKEMRNFANSNNLWIAKFTDAVKYLIVKENAVIYSWKDESKYYLALLCDFDGLELTQEITINCQFEGVQLTYNILPNKLYCIENNQIIMVDNSYSGSEVELI